MSGVKLQQIDLSAALFVQATLVEADFAGAVMSMTDFSDAMLLNAKFTGTDLRGAKFHGANLIGCNFSGARMGPIQISTLEGRRWHTRDRKSVVSGKSMSVRLYTGGLRIMKKKKNKNI